MSRVRLRTGDKVLRKMAWGVHEVASGLEGHIKCGSGLGVKESGMFLVQLEKLFWLFAVQWAQHDVR